MRAESGWGWARATSALAILCLAAAAGGASGAAPTISKTAADSCGVKVQKLQQFDEKRASKQTTRFTDAEVNSYLALELNSKYHPSLKSLTIEFEAEMLRGAATIDFDKLAMTSKSVMARVFARLLSGTHVLRVRGKLATKAGKGSFELHEAQFDNTTLPNFLVEEIITAVGRRQQPPFDPMSPSQMPYAIDRVDVRPGHILVHQ